MKPLKQGLETARSILDRIFARAVQQKPQPFRYRFSSAGDPCLRALAYDALDADAGLPPTDGARKLTWALSATCGTAVGEHLERAAVDLGGFIRQCYAEFDTGGVWIKGEADLADRWTLFDFKLVGEPAWEKIESKPNPKHVGQVNGYAVALGRKRWVLFYIRATSIFDGKHEVPEARIYEGEASVEKARDLCSVWEEVERLRASKTLPERVWGASPLRWPCGWCRHLQRCGPTEEESKP